MVLETTKDGVNAEPVPIWSSIGRITRLDADWTWNETSSTKSAWLTLSSLCPWKVSVCSPGARTMPLTLRFRTSLPVVFSSG